MHRADGFRSRQARADPDPGAASTSAPVTFVTSFFDLHGFRDAPSAYVSSFRLVSRLPPLVVYCGDTECPALRRAAVDRDRAARSPLFVRARLDEVPLWRRRDDAARAVRAMVDAPALSGDERRRSKLLSLARGDAATYADYCLLTHAKLHWLSRAARDDPFGTAGHVVWVDAGLYRYPKHVVGMNPHALGCYRGARARAHRRWRRRVGDGEGEPLPAQAFARGARHRDELQRELAPRRLCAALLGQGRRAAGGGAVFDRAGGPNGDGGGGGGRV